QHFDKPEIGLLYFRELARVLSPGGTIMINLPIHAWPDIPLIGCLKAVYAAGRKLRAAGAAFRRGVLRSPIAGTRVGRNLGCHMHCTSYEFTWLQSKLTELGFYGIEIRTFYVPTEERFHPFVFARKR